MVRSPPSAWCSPARRTSPYLIAEVRPQVNGLLSSASSRRAPTPWRAFYQIDPRRISGGRSAQRWRSPGERPPPAARRGGCAGSSRAGRSASGRREPKRARPAEAGVAASRGARKRPDPALLRDPLADLGAHRLLDGDPGALVAAYQPVPLVTVQQLDPIYVDVQQSSAELLRLQRVLASGALTRDEASASRVRLLLEDGTPYPHEGTLKFQDVSVAPTTGAVTLRMVFPNPEHQLLPGMFVRALVEEGADERAVLVPQQAVQRDPRGNAFAFAVGAGETIEVRPLQVGRAIGNRWLVTAGLGDGDRVVVDGLFSVRPGIPVKARPVDLSGMAPGAAVPGALLRCPGSQCRDAGTEE